MATLKVILTVIFILISIALTIIVLMQEGKSAGLGAISGAAETYWGKNKGRSMEGALEKITRFLVIGFIVIAVVMIPVSSKVNQAGTTGTNTNTESTNNNVEVSGMTVTTGSGTSAE